MASYKQAAATLTMAQQSDTYDTTTARILLLCSNQPKRNRCETLPVVSILSLKTTITTKNPPISVEWTLNRLCLRRYQESRLSVRLATETVVF